MSNPQTRVAEHARTRDASGPEHATGPLATNDCGTPKGYNRHHAHGEEACRPCKDARNTYVKANPNNGSYQRARQRALARLAQAHPGEYAGLLAEERAPKKEET